MAAELTLGRRPRKRLATSQRYEIFVLVLTQQATQRLATSQRYEIFVLVLTQQATQREAAERFGVDRSTVVAVCRTAKQGALDALAAAVPGRRGRSAAPASCKQSSRRSVAKSKRSSAAKPTSGPATCTSSLTSALRRTDGVKIGLTRRLDSRDRIRELGDASVPFRFDVHTMIFRDDAVGLETRLHNELGERRVNRVNLRREFFYATVAEVRDILVRIAGTHLLEYNDLPEASEWRASGGLARTHSPAPATDSDEELDKGPATGS